MTKQTQWKHCQQTMKHDNNENMSTVKQTKSKHGKQSMKTWQNNVNNNLYYTPRLIDRVRKNVWCFTQYTDVILTHFLLHLLHRFQIDCFLIKIHQTLFSVSIALNLISGKYKQRCAGNLYWHVEVPLKLRKASDNNWLQHKFHILVEVSEAQ